MFLAASIGGAPASANGYKDAGLPHASTWAPRHARGHMPEFVAEFGEGAPPQADGRLRGPAFDRNQAPIWSVVGAFLHDRVGDALELGSGTGQHVVAYAARSPAITWWPSDIHPPHLASVAAWRAHARLANVQAPLRIDLIAADWDAGLPMRDRLLAILCINVLHISPWG